MNDCECPQFCDEVCCSMCFFLKWSLLILVVGEEELSSQESNEIHGESDNQVNGEASIDDKIQTMEVGKIRQS